MAEVTAPAKVKKPSAINKRKNPIYMAFIYVICIFLLIICLFPFWLLLVNATRSSIEIQTHAVALIPSKYLQNNMNVFKGKDFNVLVGFKNSLIISASATILAVYFSSLTAYALTAYEWKLRDGFFGFIMGVMMIPGQVTAIGFYQMCYKLHLTNNQLMLILPSIAAPMMVFFMRQYLQASLSMEIVESARVDGAGEFYTFNMIVLPIMKPAMATQAIFSFVGAWNNLFTPMILLTKNEYKTMPVMVSLLKGDIYRTEYGAIYLGLFLTVLPLIIIYLLLARYIVAGVALGAVKG
ncbi:MAG: carbohydrate ABC transporter permease [Saccharofermentans sp.]|nr:carbohydrate ABC transporter permease [Saccharofermentans sp.]